MDAAGRPLSERRRSHRVLAPAHGVRSARIRGGHDATIVNLATGGACLDTRRRLLPGARVELTFIRDEGTTLHDCRVLRCAIVALTMEMIAFRAAVQFARPLPWLGATAIVVQSLSDVAVVDAEPWLPRVTARPLPVRERAADDG